MLNVADSVKAATICQSGRCSLVANLTITKGIKTFSNGMTFIGGISIRAQRMELYDSDMPTIRHSAAKNTWSQNTLRDDMRSADTLPPYSHGLLRTDSTRDQDYTAPWWHVHPGTIQQRAI
jgi:hypothetical protein